ncbi:MAG: tetratricopeptide repeat protein, partial [candidate division Zixibacteria bacterium]|nr:tetratricopeptide repeat protein [candidate division Zixibacteria bacterium]
LKPWQIDIRPTQEAVASENRIAVLPFDDVTGSGDPDQLGSIIANLLIADLSESRFMQVVSSQRIQDIRDLLEREHHSSPTTAEIIARTNARWILAGKLLQVKPHLEVTAEVVEAISGNVVASQKMSGRDGEDVFSLVDRLTVLIKNDLSLPLAAREEVDRRVSEVTTHSPEAYRYYLEGQVYYHRMFNFEAAQSFRKAIALDSTFAMAWYYLSLIDDQRLIERAVENIDHARRRDSYYILSQQAIVTGDINRAIRELQTALEENPDDKAACYQIGVYYGAKLEHQKSIDYYRRAVAIDPLYKIVYNQMAYAHDWMWQYDSAIAAIDMYIALAPDEPNPYDSRGDIYARNGRLELAGASYRRALEIKPDFWTSLYKLGRCALFLGDFETADISFTDLAACDDDTWRATGRAARAYLPIWQGRFGDALGMLDDAIAATESEDTVNEFPLFHLLKSIAYEESGDLVSAVTSMRESIRINALRAPRNKTYNRHLLVSLLARTGEIIEAENLLADLRRNTASANDTLRYRFAEASLAYAQGDVDRAIERFVVAASDSVIAYTPANGWLARVCIESNRPSEALVQLDRLLNQDFSESRAQFGGWTARAHYYKGVAFEALGETANAIAEYRIFLDLWADAQGLEPLLRIKAARASLARLTG